jgi:acyl-Coa thioesterase superfamily protein
VQLLEGWIATADGVEVVRARALQIRAATVELAQTTEPERPKLGPEQGRETDFQPAYRPMFAPDAVELRFVEGQFYGGDKATAWFRFRRPLVAGEELSPLQRLAAAGDFGNGISNALSWDHYVFINPDLTLYIERRPAGEWICLDARTRIAAGGIGISESVLYDERGRVGRATQALLVAPR